MEGLFEKVMSSANSGNTKNLMKNITEGKFTMRNLRDQFA